MQAARRIVPACHHGDAEVVLSLPVQAAVLFHGVFPGLTCELLGLVHRVLPAAGVIGLRRRAERENNEMGG